MMSYIHQRGSRSTICSAAVAACLSILLVSSIWQSVNGSDDRIKLALDYIKDREAQYEQELIEFAAIPSISALPEHKQDVYAAAEWMKKRLQQAGVKAVDILETGGAPLVYADIISSPELPTVLVYGHFDVQPAEPLELWESEPFKPEIRDGYFCGRGVDDDKGGVLPAVQAVEAILQTSGSLPVNLKFVLEGEEEIGSPYFASFLLANQQLFQADAALSADAGQISTTQPGVAVGLRGLISMDVELVSASTDMHSGSNGGSVVNPLHALARLIGSLHLPNGAVAVEGFYDDVEQLGADEREDFTKYPFDADQEKETFGLLGFTGEEGYSVLERRWVRPTLDVVGMHGGFTGQGIKTIIPAKAHAKVSCRLVPRQQPQDILDKVEKHLRKHQPPLTNLTVTFHAGKAAGVKMPKDLPATKAVATVLKEVMGAEPVYYREGGTIGALGSIKDILGVDTTMFGFCLGERIHAPNERLLTSFYHKGREAWIRLLGMERLATLLSTCKGPK